MTPVRNKFWFQKAARLVKRNLRFRQKPRIPGNTREALANLRRTGVLPPPPETIDTTPLAFTTSPPFNDAFDQAVYEVAWSLDPVGRIAFDLDDTLLLNSRALRDAWIPDPGKDEHGQELVECVLLPGAMALLAGLRKAGNELALITTSSRRRVDYIFTRLPELKNFFSPTNQETDFAPLVATCEEIADAQHRNPKLRPAPGTIGLTNKTPNLAEFFFGCPGYNLIIDDSTEVAATLTALGQQALLIPVHTGKPDASTAWQIIHDIARTTSQNFPYINPPSPTTPSTYFSDPFFLADLCCGNALIIGKDIREFSS